MNVSQTTHCTEHHHEHNHQVMVDVSQTTHPAHFLGHFNIILYQISHRHQSIVSQTTDLNTI